MKETPFDDDKLHEECGVFGVFDHEAYLYPVNLDERLSPPIAGRK